MSSYSHPLVASKFMKPFSRPFHINGNSFFQLGCTSNKRWQYFSIHIPVEYIDADKPLVSNPIIMLLTDFTERLENFSEFTKSLSQMGNFVVEFDIANATSGFIMESGIIPSEVKDIINDRFGNELIKITDNLIDVISESPNKQDEVITKLSSEFDEFLLDIGLEIISLSEVTDPKAALEVASKKVSSGSLEIAKRSKFTYFNEGKNNTYNITLIHPSFVALHAAHPDYMAKYNQITHFFEELLIDIKKYYDQKNVVNLDLEISIILKASYNNISVESFEVTNANSDDPDQVNMNYMLELTKSIHKYFYNKLSKNLGYVEFVTEFNKNAISFTKELKSEVAREAFRKMVIKVAFVDGLTQLTFIEKDTDNSAVVSFAPNILPSDRLIKLCNAVEEKISYGLIEHLGISKTTASAVTRFIESSNSDIDVNYAKTLLQLMAFH